MSGEKGFSVPTECERLHQALRQCHHRVPNGLARESTCRHLNRSLAQCLLSVACPAETDAVRSLCGSSGTALKRSQCHQAELSLATCLSSRQDQS